MAKRKRNRTYVRTTCILRGCRNTIYSRGLCRACYVAAIRRIRAGEFTDEEAVKKGIILPRYKNIRNRNTWAKTAKKVIHCRPKSTQPKSKR